MDEKNKMLLGLQDETFKDSTVWPLVSTATIPGISTIGKSLQKPLPVLSVYSESQGCEYWLLPEEVVLGWFEKAGKLPV